MRIETVSIGKVKPNPNNPRVINNKIIFVCKTCGKLFTSRKTCSTRTPMYCSRECFGESKKKYKICKQCGKRFANWTRKIFCSEKCRIDSTIGVKLSEKHKKALSEGRKKSEKCKGPNLYNWKGGQETYIQRMREHNLKRYHLKRAGGAIDFEYIKALKVVQQNKCFYCEIDLKKGKTHIEHLHPISKGGSNAWYNLVISCQSCNNQKKDNVFTDFVIKKIQPQWIDKSIIVQSAAYRLSHGDNYAAT